MKKIIISTLTLAVLLLVNSPASAEGDAVKGKKIANKCKACHTLKKGGKNKVGPNLWNIVDRGIAEIEGFKYSKAFKAKKGTMKWDETTLNTFIKKPRKWEKKTKMTFPGIRKDAKRADLIAYLKTLKD